jgi:hypothetical protein
MTFTIEDVRCTVQDADARLARAAARDLEIALGHLANAYAQLQLVIVERRRSEQSQLTLPHAGTEHA